ncbi:MAG: LPXTG-motif cell wall anchor domain protein [Actinotalea sp.]|nr:LPXTG-motif cell wall anchor domain protein [Actinotalea sp.]
MRPPEAPARPGGARTFALVGLGGAVGGLLRHAFTLAAPDQPTGFGWTVLAVNAVGSFVLGALAAGLPPGHAPAWLRPLLGPGLLGGFTTFSAVAHTTALTAGSGGVGVAVAHLLLSVAVGVVGALLGVLAGHEWLRPTRRSGPVSSGVVGSGEP